MTQQANGTREKAVSERTLALFEDLRENYLKEFIRKNKVTPEEYRKAVLFLQKTGDAGEIPLMADVFLETTVDAVAHENWTGSETTIEGPYYVGGAPILERPYIMPMRDDEAGEPLFFSGTVKGDDGTPLSGAELDIWHCDDEGFYSNIHEGIPDWNLRSRIYTDEEGRFEVRTTLPVPYEIPKYGPTGEILRALGSHTWRPAHIHLKVSHEGYETSTTQIFFEGGEWINDDCVDAVKDELLGKVVKHEGESEHEEYGFEGQYSTLDYDFVLVPSRETATR